MTSQITYALSKKWIRERFLYWGLITLGALYVIIYTLFQVSTWGVSSYVLAALAGIFILVAPLRFSLRDLRKYHTYRDTFFIADKSGVTIFGKHVPWNALNEIKRQGSILKIYVADPTSVDPELYDTLFARSRDSQRAREDLYISPAAFEVSIDEVVLDLQRIRPAINESAIDRSQAVARGKMHRSNNFLITFGIVIALLIGVGIWIVTSYGVGPYLVTFFILLGVCIYMMYEVWKLRK